jgi:hypothetical protein
VSGVSGLTRAILLEFLRRHRLAVQASRPAPAGVQAAVVGIAVSEEFELVFDTLASTRKAHNLREDPHIAFVIGGLGADEEETVQYEGLADCPGGSELEVLQALYFETFPDGRERLGWPGITYFRAKPHWLRYSNYRVSPPLIVELTAADLAVLR